MHRHNGRTKQISLLNTIITEDCFGKKKYNTKTHRYTTDKYIPHSLHTLLSTDNNIQYK